MNELDFLLRLTVEDATALFDFLYRDGWGHAETGQAEPLSEKDVFRTARAFAEELIARREEAQA